MLLALAIFHGVEEAVQGRPSPRFQRLGPLLRQARRRQGVGIEVIHQRCGISRSQLFFYETEHAKNPGLRVLQALARGYRLPLMRVLLSAMRDC